MSQFSSNFFSRAFFPVHVSSPVNHCLSCVFLHCPCIEPCQSLLVLCISSLSVYRTLSIIACLVYFFSVRVSNPVNHRLSCVFLPCPCIEPCQSSLVLCISSLSVYRTLSIIACLVYFFPVHVSSPVNHRLSCVFPIAPQTDYSATQNPRYIIAVFHPACNLYVLSPDPSILLCQRRS